ncbi:MAG: VacB/RNase II family 3'-5' exoribonuclease [Rhodobacteraceae bacterium]|nr:VacB/RNase II family 3'-5' exoribonuclease [Paracoccaceae bacterium]
MRHLPGKDEILAWIADNPGHSSSRDIARAFHVTGAAQSDLKRLLKVLARDGHLKTLHTTSRPQDTLPPVAVLRISPPDNCGDLFARPLEWHGDGPEPRVLFEPRPTDPALGEGDRILARLQKVQGEDHHYIARLIRRIGTTPRRILGVFRAGARGGRIVPISKGNDREWTVAAHATHGARDGELVRAEPAAPPPRTGLTGWPPVRIVERLGTPGAPGAVSLIAIHEHGLSDAFPNAVIAEAESAKPATLSGRMDLRDMPFITIDPAGAHDHDDACCAMADDNPNNRGGFVIWVAIADVAHYVRPGSALDQEAKQRGNSTYFPDRVVPMLPERLSGGLCSLHAGVPRACLAVRMVIDARGRKIDHAFHRGLMCAAAVLTYEQVQAARDGNPDKACAPLLEPVIQPLFAAYEALKCARAKRQPLDLDLPERQITLARDGRVTSVTFRERLDAHRLIEEFMILANVTAAQVLAARRSPFLYRVHEEPDPKMLERLRQTAQTSGFALAKGQVLHTRHLNALLAAAAKTDHSAVLSLSTLRTMPQAYYAPQNHGHFGLALKAYAHFTSPIRRYADLLVHRALITAHGWGRDGAGPDDFEHLAEVARHVSEAEHRSTLAERDTADRYLAAFLADRVGATFTGRISGIARFGAFVRLDQTGADGLLPMRALGREYFRHDAGAQTLTGADTGRLLAIGQRVTVRLSRAVPLTGGLILELISVDGQDPWQPPGTGRRRGTPRAKSAGTGRKTPRNRCQSGRFAR